MNVFLQRYDIYFVSSVCIVDLAFGPHPNRIFTWITIHQVKTRARLAVSQGI